jgi:hypothetical protein
VAKIAGGSVLSLRTFLEQRYGDGTFERIVERLPPEQAEALRGIVMPVRWYPLEAFLGVLHATEAETGDADLWERYGAYAAEFEITAFQRFVLRFTSPLFFLDRAGRMWHRFHDSGEWQVEGGDKHLHGALSDFAVVDEKYCRVLAAWIKRAGEMTGARGEVSHPECRAHGAPACVFTGWWT